MRLFLEENVLAPFDNLSMGFTTRDGCRFQMVDNDSKRRFLEDDASVGARLRLLYIQSYNSSAPQPSAAQCPAAAHIAIVWVTGARRRDAYGLVYTQWD